MTRDEVLELIRAHLADELELDPARIEEGTRFKEDLEADSLDLYTLVQELEDSYGVRMSDEEAARILTVGQAVDFVAARTAADRERPERWSALPTCSTELPEDLAPAGRSRTPRGPSGARTPTSAWPSSATPCSALAVTTHLYPRLEAERLRRRAADEDPRPGGLGPLVPRGRRAARRARARCARAAPAGVGAGGRGAGRDRARAGLGHRGGDRRLLPARSATSRTAEAVVEAFAPEIEEALEHPVDFKSALQERLARRGERRRLHGRRRGRPAARPHVRGRGRGRRAVEVGARVGPLQEGRRAGGRPRRAGRVRGD